MRILVLGWIISCGLTASFGSSGAGTGGDSSERLLGAARGATLATLRAILQRPATASLCRCPSDNQAPMDALFCRHLERLSDEQATYCDAFFRGVITQVVGLAGDENRSPFVLSTKPLTVTGPNGTRPVLAKTLMFPSGPVWFDYRRLGELAPANAVALMAHEFGHKSIYSPHHKYLSDDEPIGPFREKDGGRRLLDSFGSAVAMHAQRLGLVGRSGSLRDRFRCWIEPIEPVGFPFFVQGTSLRIVGTDERYETGVGLRPGDLSCALRDLEGAREINAVVRIEEPHGCAASPAGRATKMQLWDIRRKKDAEGFLKIETKSIGEQTRQGWNPICEDSAPLVVETTIDEKKYRFTVVYDGSEAAKKELN